MTGIFQDDYFFPHDDALEAEEKAEREKAEFRRESMAFLVRLINERYPQQPMRPEDDPFAWDDHYPTFAERLAESIRDDRRSDG